MSFILFGVLALWGVALSAQAEPLSEVSIQFTLIESSPELAVGIDDSSWEDGAVLFKQLTQLISKKKAHYVFSQERVFPAQGKFEFGDVVPLEYPTEFERGEKEGELAAAAFETAGVGVSIKGDVQIDPKGVVTLSVGFKGKELFDRYEVPKGGDDAWIPVFETSEVTSRDIELAINQHTLISDWVTPKSNKKDYERKHSFLFVVIKKP